MVLRGIHSYLIAFACRCRISHRTARGGVNCDGQILSAPEPDEAASSSARKTIPVTLRIPRGLLKQVDEVLKTRAVSIPRHKWLLEAVHEKLARMMTDD